MKYLRVRFPRKRFGAYFAKVLLCLLESTEREREKDIYSFFRRQGRYARHARGGAMEQRTREYLGVPLQHHINNNAYWSHFAGVLGIP